MCNVGKVCGWEALVVEITPDTLTYLRVAVLATLSEDGLGDELEPDGETEERVDEEPDGEAEPGADAQSP